MKSQLQPHSVLSVAPVLAVQGLRKDYAGAMAVGGVSFAVHAGEIVGLLGPNGAGKTTTISMILGVLEPSAGSIHIAGYPMATQRSAALAHTNFAAVYAPLLGNLTVAENLSIFGKLYTVPNLRHRIAEVAAALGIEPVLARKYGVLSSGEQARVGLAKALLNAPQLLLLDEPTASLDPATARAMRQQIRMIARDQGCAVLWTSHNMNEVEDMCDRVLFMAEGQVQAEGDPRTLPQSLGLDSMEALFLRYSPQEAEGVA